MSPHRDSPAAFSSGEADSKREKRHRPETWACLVRVWGLGFRVSGLGFRV